MKVNQSFRIFIIEDNELMAEMTKDQLIHKFGHAEVTVFNSGEDALNIENTEPDIIILDHQLDSQNQKALNGIQILLKLKKKFNAPVIFLSAQEKPEVAANIIKYGAYEYVTKNKDSFQRIEVIINNILNSPKAEKKTDSQKTLIYSLSALVILLSAIIILLLMKQ